MIQALVLNTITCQAFGQKRHSHQADVENVESGSILEKNIIPRIGKRKLQKLKPHLQKLYKTLLRKDAHKLK